MKSCCSFPLHARLRHVLSRGFFRYGHVVARFPWLFILLPGVVMSLLAVGIMKTERNDIFGVDINLPRDIQSVKDQARVHSLFPDRTRDHYDALELIEDQIMGSIIFKAKHNSSIYDEDVTQEIRDVIADVKTNVTITVDNVTLNFQDLCGRRHNVCVVTGERLLAPQFNAMRKLGMLSYPKWKLPTTGEMVDLSFALADSDSKLDRVGAARVTFKLRHDLKPHVFLWEEAFVQYMQTLQLNKSNVCFSASSSVSREQDDIFHADVVYVWWCLALIIIVTFLVTWGADVVSTRILLVPMGVVPPVLGVMAAMGLLGVSHVQVVDMVWLVPLLVLGKGVTDMALLMASWGSRLEETGEAEQEVARRVGWCLVDVGPPLTISSLTLVTGFCVAYTSTLPALANFALYTGVSMLFCYLATMTFTVGCLAVHAQRVLSLRHTVTCHVTASRDHLKREGENACMAVLCGGSSPEVKYADQGFLERIPRLVLVKLMGNLVAKIFITLLYLGLLAVSIYGIMDLKKGVELTTLVPESTFSHRYLNTDNKYFGFSFPVVFITDERVQYNQNTSDLLEKLVNKARQDPDIQDDFLRCWAMTFHNSSSYNLTTDGENFSAEAVQDFLSKSETFKGDVILDKRRENIVASRCYVFSKKNSDPEELTGLMRRMRNLTYHAGFPVFAYHPAFLVYDQRLAILPNLLKTVGILIAVLCVVYLLVFLELVTWLLAVFSAVSIMVGIIGLMTFMDVAVSFVSITPVVMGAGFAVYFSMVVCAAYLQSDFSARADRVTDTVARAAAPVLTAALSILAGTLLFLVASSFHFSVVFKVTLLTLLLVIFHTTFFIPAVLSLIGCEKSQEEINKDQSLRDDLQQIRVSGVICNCFVKRPGRNKNATPAFPHINRGFDDSITGKHSGKYDNTNTHGSTRYSKMQNGTRPEIEIPKADYDDVSETVCPHGLSSNSFANTGRSMSSGGYQNISNLYENWPKRKSESRNIYDVPTSLPSSHSGYRDDTREYGNMEADFSDQPLRQNSIPSPSNRKPIPKEPKSPYPDETGEEPEAEIVASLRNMDDFAEPPHEPAASLESVHHVACTLSTNGKLGSTQAYVTENFYDIPR